MRKRPCSRSGGGSRATCTTASTQELLYIGRRATRLAATGDETAREIQASAERAIGDSRRAIAALTRPLDQPLDEVLTEAVEEVAARYDVQLDLAFDPAVSVGADAREALVRIACEAVSNAARHGHAKRRARLALERQRRALRRRRRRRRLRPDVPNSSRFGIAIMRERAQAAGGSFRASLRARPRHRTGGGVPMTTLTAVAPVRVLIADDHAPTRSDVREALEESGRFTVCAEAPDAAAAVEAAVRERPEVCVLDVRMPGGGVAAVWEIAARLPETKIVMLTVSADDGDLFAALRAGADGYLLKATDLGPLPEALEDVLAGTRRDPARARGAARGGVPRPAAAAALDPRRATTARS